MLLPELSGRKFAPEDYIPPEWIGVDLVGHVVAGSVSETKAGVMPKEDDEIKITTNKNKNKNKAKQSTAFGAQEGQVVVLREEEHTRPV